MGSHPALKEARKRVFGAAGSVCGFLEKEGPGAIGKYVGQEGRHADLRTEVLSARAVGPGSKARGPCCSHGGGSLVTMGRSLISLVAQ